MRYSRTMAVTAGILCSVLLVGYTAPKKKVKLPSTYEVRNIHAAIDKEYDSELVQDLCRKFTMNEAEVRAFFKKADVMSAHVRQHGYDWLPCLVQGELVLDGKPATFQIESSATGWIKFSNGKTVHLGCRDACTELFKDK
jgi:hypothetical protein